MEFKQLTINTNNKKIEIRGYFSDWHEVDREKAEEYIINKLKKMTPLSNIYEYIEHRFLRGITVQELLKGNPILEIVDEEIKGCISRGYTNKYTIK